MSNNDEHINVSSSSSSNRSRRDDNQHVQQLAGANAIPDNMMVIDRLSRLSNSHLPLLSV